MADPFFDSLNKSIDNLVPLAMKKWEIDRQAEALKVKNDQFNQTLAETKRGHDIASAANIFRAKAMEDTAASRLIESQGKAADRNSAAEIGQSILAGNPGSPIDFLQSKLPNVNDFTAVGPDLQLGSGPIQAADVTTIQGPPTPLTPEQVGNLILTKGTPAQQLQVALKQMELGKASKATEQWSDPYEAVVGGKKLMLKKNLTTNEVKPVAQDISTTVHVTGGASGLPQPPALPQGVPGQINEGAFQGLTPTQKETVKAIAEYRFPVSNLRNKEMMALVQRAYLYDPTFDAKEYAVRSKVRSDFTSGKSANNIKSLNTAVGHLDELSKAAKDLDNAPVQLWNTIANYGLTKTGDSRVTKFNTAATAVEGELANVFKNSGATDQEIKAWRANLDTSQSPKQLKDNIDMAISLLGGRLGALQSTYEVGLGKAKDFTFLSDKSRKILTNLGADVDKLDPVPTVPKGKTASSVDTPAKNAKGWTLKVDAKGNKAYVAPNGRDYEEVK